MRHIVVNTDSYIFCYNVPMKEVKQTIIINRPVHEVFDFTLNPKNTPKWIDSIVIEQRNESPTRLGTIYRNQDRQGNWNEYEITSFEPDEHFTFSRKNGNYHVKYTFKPLDNDRCELEYYEWDEKDDMSQLFDNQSLKKILLQLKDVIEEV